ncbi:hypothetical protein [Shewanella sp. 4_MG-2023]|uniref:hypothetical protein n=1 Tax=Shewanella sp. 4_MG-2023 TaxID=3062652 RepID=UPI0026E4791E|nr:hypothetical protein [Shewanella sp. 4_MG-2023]MDO6678094.1 hypothetical protein [Shewanella sp. 4_MG-2023]
MKKAVCMPLLFTMAVSMSGCKSMDLQSYLGDFEPSANDIYNGTIAFCSIPYDSLTSKVGNSSSKSPEERKAYKDRVWSNWEDKRKELIAHFESKQFTMSQSASFSTFDEATGLMKLSEKGHVTGKASSERSAIPNKVAFNTYDGWFSPKLPTGWVPYQAGTSRQHEDARKVRFALNTFGKSVNGWGNDVYVINDYDDFSNPYHETRIADYGGTGLNRLSVSQSNSKHPLSISVGGTGSVKNVRYPNKLMSVLFDTNRWYENIESPVLLKNESFYLDTKKVNIYDTFGVYPDIGKASIDITYTFKFTGCSQGQLLAEVNEISITPINSFKEIYKANL